MRADWACFILSWRYEPPYTQYNCASLDFEEDLACLLDPLHAYYAIFDTPLNLIGFACFGPDGQVFGGDYHQPALDIGAGLRPDLTGQGQGRAFIGGIFAFAQERYPTPCYRVTIADFNQRAKRVWQAVGFRVEQRFRHPVSRQPFVVLTLSP